MKKYKEGDIIEFEQCWEDEHGNFHDEEARLIRIDANGNLELEWLVEDPRIKEYLELMGLMVSDLPE